MIRVMLLRVVRSSNQRKDPEKHIQRSTWEMSGEIIPSGRPQSKSSLGEHSKTVQQREGCPSPDSHSSNAQLTPQWTIVNANELHY